MILLGKEGDSMEKKDWIKLRAEIKTFDESDRIKTPDEVLYKFLLKIMNDDEMNLISGIHANRFIKDAINDFIAKKNFTPNYRKGIFNTLKVYYDNIKNQGKLR